MRTEDDIRAAFGALARQAEDADAVPAAIQDELARVSAGRRRVRLRHRRSLLSAVAAAAVIAIAAIAFAVAGHQAPPPPPRPTSGSGPVLDHGVPRYRLELAGKPEVIVGGQVRFGVPDAVVKQTLTGAKLAVARPPAPYVSFAAASGAGDDRTFVLAAWRDQPGSAGGSIMKLYVARFSPALGTLKLWPLPIPAFTDRTVLEDFALSPSGTELAVAVRTGLNDSVFQVRLYSLDAQLLRIWQGRGSLIGAYLENNSISWSATGMLAITWIPKATQGVYLLNTHAASGSLAAESRLVVPAGSKNDPFRIAGAGILSGNGRTLVVPMNVLEAEIPAIGGEFQKFSAVSGQEIGAFWPVHSADESAIWSNTSGSVLVVYASLTSGPHSGSRATVGVLRGNRFTPLPGVPTVVSVVF